MKLFKLDEIPNKPTIDLLSGSRQIFQDKPPNILPFLVKNLRKAECVLIPHDVFVWTDDYFNHIKSISADIPVLFFNRSDNPLSVNLSNSFSLQNTYSKSVSAQQIIVPYNVISLERAPLRKYKSKPTVSFVGFVPGFSPRRVLTAVGNDFPYSLVNNPTIVRRFGVRRLERRFEDSLVVKRSMYGGARSLLKEPELWRREFLEAIYLSDFVFCPRGDANSSQRLYETLSSGRIPILPNTNQKFPVFKDDFCLHHVLTSITSRDVHIRVADFWDKLNSSSYTQIQQDLRLLYKCSLNYAAFILKLFSLDIGSFRKYVC